MVMAKIYTNTVINKINILEDDGKKEIKYVYHLADIHIRNYQRHQEYQEVFNRLYKKIKDEHSIIVIAGDIMHSKTELSPEAINITYYLFKRLSEIAPVFIIAGNHDCNLSNKNRLDALSPIVEDIGNLPNFYYLKKSGIYQYYNILFGVTSILENIFVDIPSNKHIKKMTQKNKYKIALFHGPVHGAKTDVGYRFNNSEFLVEDFKNYDYVFLGDIHKHQYLNNEKTIAYAGSLIQQSFGESIDFHGMIKWDLNHKTSKHIAIKNDYSYCTILIKDGKIADNVISKKPRIRFIVENTSQNQYQDILDSLNKKYEIQEIVKETNIIKRQTFVEKQTISFKDYLVKKKIQNPLKQEIIDLHHSIYEKVLCIKKDQVSDAMHNADQVQQWKILELKFSNMLSFGENNVIDFRQYETNKIIGIMAPNHYGKSAILDIILFCLFDRFSRGVRKDILNKNKDTLSCSLLLQIGCIKYLIKREGKRSGNKSGVKISVDFYAITIKNNEEIYENLNDVSTLETNKKIIELLGNYNDYLTTCFYLQNKENSFIDMKQLQKKEYLHEILKLNIYEDCCAYAKEKQKEISIEIKLLDNMLDKYKFDECKKNYRELDKINKKLEIEKINLTWNVNYIDQVLKIYKDRKLEKHEELEKYQIQNYEDIQKNIEHIENNIFNRKTDYAAIRKEIETLKNQLSEKENIDHLKIYKNIVNEKENLMKKLIHVSEEDHDINNLVNERNIIKEKLKQLSVSLEDVKHVKTNKKFNETQTETIQLRNQIKPIANINFDPELYMQLQFNISKNIHNAHLHPDVILYSVEDKKEFIGFLEENITLLENNNLIENFQNKIEEYKKWITKMKTMSKINFMDLCNQSTNLLVFLKQDTFNIINKYDNEVIIQKIKENEQILCKINLLNEEKLLIGTLKDIDNKIEQCKLRENNSIVLEEINMLDNKLKNIDETQKILTEKIKDLQLSIAHREKLLEDEQINKNIILRDLNLLKKYKIEYLIWQQRSKIYLTCKESKSDYENKINLLQRKINENNTHMIQYDKDIQAYLDIRKTIDEKNKELNIINNYIQIVNYNGLPYEILKSYLPLIESNINQILHSMVNFNIEFVFHNEDQKVKTNIGSLNINLYYNNETSYDAQLASGFEKFMIEIALRIVLCKISTIAKPNFIIIDEGWSCLDKDNLGNVTQILNNIKLQYDNIILISHLDELKNQVDYTINIDKKDNFSFVNNINNFIK